MSGISYAQQMIWRKEIQLAIGLRTNKDVTYIHPPQYYGYHEQLHKSEQEIKDWELQQVCDSDIVIVNLEDIDLSIGSHIELGAVCGANLVGSKHINVVSFGKPKENLHPWISLCCLRHEDDMNDLADYIATYLLV
jgi:hypothetical protein